MMRSNWIKIVAPALIIILLEFVAYRLWEGRPHFPTKLERLEEAMARGPNRPTVTPGHRAALATKAATGSKGMTWKVSDKFKPNPGIVFVGCDGCEPYHGDTSCETELPVLCFKDEKSIAPSDMATNVSKYSWSGGRVAITEPIAASKFATIGAANGFCAAAFGNGWRVAEHHDGYGDWSFFAKGTLPPNQRFWTDIRGQPATCWHQ